MNDCLTRTETAAAVAKLDKFAYDLDDQVTEARYNVDEQHSTQDRLCNYDYDPAGNRNTMTDSIAGPTSYTVNDLNQYTAAGSGSMDYDLNGNLTHQGLWTYVYDAQNRLVSASSPSQQVDFAYDPRNRCVRRTSSTGSTQGPTMSFYYDGWDLIEEYSGGVLLARYVHGAREDEMIAKIDSYGTIYYHTDAEGSVVALTNTSGNVVERYKYDAFGKPSFLDSTSQPINGSTVGNRFLFTGREWLPDLDLYDYRNRVYSPEFGRFLQSDPKSFDADPTNLYRYCGNEPIDGTDPMGLEDPVRQTPNPMANERPPDYGASEKIEAAQLHFNVRGTHISESNTLGNLSFGIIVGTAQLEGKTVNLFGDPWSAGRYGADQDYQKTHQGGMTQEFWGTIQQVNGFDLYAATSSKPGGQALKKENGEKAEGGTVHSAIAHERFGGFNMVGWHYSHPHSDLIRGNADDMGAAENNKWMRFAVCAAKPARKGSWDKPVFQGYDGKTHKFLKDEDFPR